MSGLAAVIPAAGLSSRMGRFKPLLPLGGGTVLSRCVGLFRAAGIEHIVVVTGNRGEEVAEAARQLGAVPVHNADFEQGMFSSMVTGVQAVPDDVEGFFVLPVDIPLVRLETVTRLAKAFRQTRPDVLYPRFLWERGHPPVINGALIPDILAHDGKGGLRTVLDAHESRARDLDVADIGTVRDLDHPEDYEQALSLVDKGFPTDAECDQLWSMYGLPGGIIDHCRAVARVADTLCGRLNARQGAHPLDPAMVRSLALTHDVGKGTRRHEKAGSERLTVHGFPVAADFALAHFDMALSEDEPVTEKIVVFLADKLVKDVAPVPLESRYLEKVEMFGHEPGAREAILGRLERAKGVLDRVNREIGASAEALAREALG